MQNSNAIQSFVIVGGGTAGWISAAILARNLPSQNVQITLIESPNVPTIGVGEATIPSMVDLLRYLKIPLDDFIQKTNATFKLGIEFTNWLTLDHKYWHPFGHVGNHIDGKPFYQHWLKHHLNDGSFQFCDFSPAVHLARQNRFFIQNTQQKTPLNDAAFALHFDATLVAEYLKQYCLKLGVKRVESHVCDVISDERGFISTLHLTHSNLKGASKQISADFFIDCSGQNALLIGKKLRIAYQNWQHFLPVDKAVVAQSKLGPNIPPYTKSIAEKSGWRWQIPLQNRMGNGYVFCSDFCSDEQAIEVLQNNVDNLLSEPRIIKFTTGKREKSWYKNCLAVGLSAGFLEPLESTGIYLIMKAMLNFIELMPDKTCPAHNTDEFNRLMDNEFINIRDFIVLHYCLSKRTDSAFWQMWQTLTIPAELKQKIQLFENFGRLYHNPQDLFAQDSWYAIYAGMGKNPNQYDPFIDFSNFPVIEKAFKQSYHLLLQSAAHAPMHNEFLQVNAEK
ncbi:tryptophan halogenase family protein [Catenovulum sediminis]|uniref:Tryptophan halogenase family protein n=1 Tax=Catenovulum sediminis TaxID=1740262 RepID=A0ABV1RCZ7_9ALTE